MKAKHLVICAGIFLTTAAVCFAAEKPPQQQPVMSTTQADQTGVALTVYNVNLGLVKDRRNINLARGRSDLRFMDVAAQIIPASVHIKSLADPESLTVLEQNYEYDLMSPQKLMDKYVGKEVKLYQKNPYSEREETGHRHPACQQQRSHLPDKQRDNIQSSRPGHSPRPAGEPDRPADPGLAPGKQPRQDADGGGVIPDQWHNLEGRLCDDPQ